VGHLHTFLCAAPLLGLIPSHLREFGFIPHRGGIYSYWLTPPVGHLQLSGEKLRNAGGAHPWHKLSLKKSIINSRVMEHVHRSPITLNRPIYVPICMPIQALMKWKFSKLFQTLKYKITKNSRWTNYTSSDIFNIFPKRSHSHDIPNFWVILLFNKRIRWVWKITESSGLNRCSLTKPDVCLLICGHDFPVDFLVFAQYFFVRGLQSTVL